MAEPESEQTINVAIEWHVGDTLTSQYANHLLVQRTPQEVFLSFFELVPPLVVGTAEEQLAQMQTLARVRAECVARIVIPVSSLEAVTTALNDVLSRSAAPSDNSDTMEQHL
jgi:hypothetical protein